MVYVPYWRFKGLEFTLGDKRPGFRVIDHSHRAVKINDFPVSLGFRSQTQSLKFIQKEVAGSFLTPDITQKEIIGQISGSSEKKIHIGEILSLIFMPFYRDKDRLIDGLSGKILEKSLILASDQKRPNVHHIVTPSLCPNCGWALKGRTTSLVLHCTHCERVWLIHRKKLNSIKFRVADIHEKTDILIPFWRFSIMFKNLELSTFAQLIKIANLSKVIRKSDETQRLYFYIPAFKINPKLFLRISKQTTLAQMAFLKMTALPKIDFLPADLSLEEGFQAVFPLLMELCANKKETWAVLKTEQLKLTSFDLTYLGFQKAGSEYVQDTLCASLPVNSIRFGQKL